MGFGSKRDEDLVFQKNKIEFLIFLSFGFEDGWWTDSDENHMKMKKRLKAKLCVGGLLLNSMVLHDLTCYFVLKWSEG